MTPGLRRPAPAEEAGFGLAALVSLLLHTTALAGLIWLVQHEPRPEAAPEQGVEIVWDQDSGEAVGAAEVPAPPGALNNLMDKGNAWSRHATSSANEASQPSSGTQRLCQPSKAATPAPP